MEQKDRPVIEIKKARVEMILDVLTIIVGIAVGIYFLMNWMKLPNHVAIHFNSKGEADNWGGKWVLWIPLFIGFIFWAWLTRLEKYPHKFNYTNLTLENVEKQYKHARIMLNVVKTEITIFMFYVSCLVLKSSLNGKIHGNFIGLSVLMFFVLLVITIGLNIFKSYRLKSE